MDYIDFLLRGCGNEGEKKEFQRHARKPERPATERTASLQADAAAAGGRRGGGEALETLQITTAAAVEEEVKKEVAAEWRRERKKELLSLLRRANRSGRTFDASLQKSIDELAALKEAPHLFPPRELLHQLVRERQQQRYSVQHQRPKEHISLLSRQQTAADHEEGRGSVRGGGDACLFSSVSSQRHSSNSHSKQEQQQQQLTAAECLQQQLQERRQQLLRLQAQHERETSLAAAAAAVERVSRKKKGLTFCMPVAGRLGGLFYTPQASSRRSSSRTSSTTVTSFTSSAALNAYSSDIPHVKRHSSPGGLLLQQRRRRAAANEEAQGLSSSFTSAASSNSSSSSSNSSSSNGSDNNSGITLLKGVNGIPRPAKRWVGRKLVVERRTGRSTVVYDPFMKAKGATAAKEATAEVGEDIGEATTLVEKTENTEVAPTRPTKDPAAAGKAIAAGKAAAGAGTAAAAGTGTTATAAAEIAAAAAGIAGGRVRGREAGEKKRTAGRATEIGKEIRIQQGAIAGARAAGVTIPEEGVSSEAAGASGLRNGWAARLATISWKARTKAEDTSSPRTTGSLRSLAANPAPAAKVKRRPMTTSSSASASATAVSPGSPLAAVIHQSHAVAATEAATAETGTTAAAAVAEIAAAATAPTETETTAAAAAAEIPAAEAAAAAGAVAVAAETEVAAPEAAAAPTAAAVAPAVQPWISLPAEGFRDGSPEAVAGLSFSTCAAAGGATRVSYSFSGIGVSAEGTERGAVAAREPNACACPGEETATRTHCDGFTPAGTVTGALNAATKEAFRVEGGEAEGGRGAAAGIIFPANSDCQERAAAESTYSGAALEEERVDQLSNSCIIIEQEHKEFDFSGVHTPQLLSHTHVQQEQQLHVPPSSLFPPSAKHHHSQQLYAGASRQQEQQKEEQQKQQQQEEHQQQEQQQQREREQILFSFLEAHRKHQQERENENQREEGERVIFIPPQEQQVVVSSCSSISIEQPQQQQPHLASGDMQMLPSDVFPCLLQQPQETAAADHVLQVPTGAPVAASPPDLIATPVVLHADAAGSAAAVSALPAASFTAVAADVAVRASVSVAAAATGASVPASAAIAAAQVPQPPHGSDSVSLQPKAFASASSFVLLPAQSPAETTATGAEGDETKQAQTAAAAVTHCPALTPPIPFAFDACGRCSSPQRPSNAGLSLEDEGTRRFSTVDTNEQRAAATDIHNAISAVSIAPSSPTSLHVSLSPASLAAVVENSSRTEQEPGMAEKNVVRTATTTSSVAHNASASAAASLAAEKHSTLSAGVPPATGTPAAAASVNEASSAVLAVANLAAFFKTAASCGADRLSAPAATTADPFAASTTTHLPASAATVLSPAPAAPASLALSPGDSATRLRPPASSAGLPRPAAGSAAALPCLALAGGHPRATSAVGLPPPAAASLPSATAACTTLPSAAAAAKTSSPGKGAAPLTPAAARRANVCGSETRPNHPLVYSARAASRRTREEEAASESRKRERNLLEVLCRSNSSTAEAATALPAVKSKKTNNSSKEAFKEPLPPEEKVRNSHTQQNARLQQLKQQQMQHQQVLQQQTQKELVHQLQVQQQQEYEHRRQQQLSFPPSTASSGTRRISPAAKTNVLFESVSVKSKTDSCHAILQQQPPGKQQRVQQGQQLQTSERRQGRLQEQQGGRQQLQMGKSGEKVYTAGKTEGNTSYTGHASVLSTAAAAAGGGTCPPRRVNATPAVRHKCDTTSTETSCSSSSLGREVGTLAALANRSRTSQQTNSRNRSASPPKRQNTTTAREAMPVVKETVQREKRKKSDSCKEKLIQSECFRTDVTAVSSRKPCMRNTDTSSKHHGRFSSSECESISGSRNSSSTRKNASDRNEERSERTSKGELRRTCSSSRFTTGSSRLNMSSCSNLVTNNSCVQKRETFGRKASATGEIQKEKKNKSSTRENEIGHVRVISGVPQPPLRHTLVLNDNSLVARAAAGNYRLTSVEQRRFFIPGAFAACGGPTAGCPAQRKASGEGPFYPSISVRSGFRAATPRPSVSAKHISETVSQKSTSRQLFGAALPMTRSGAASGNVSYAVATRAVAAVHSGAATIRRSDAAAAGHAIRTAAVDTCEKKRKTQHNSNITREKCPATTLPHAGAPHRMQSRLPLGGRMIKGRITVPSDSWRSACIFSAEQKLQNKNITASAHADRDAVASRQAPVAAIAPKAARKRKAETASLTSEDERSVDDEEEWSESDYDFIDDETEKEHGETEERNWQKEMRSVTRYDPRNYRDLDTEECEESNFDRVYAEEIFSAKVGQREDEEELHLQQQKIGRKGRQKKRKKNRTC